MGLIPESGRSPGGGNGNPHPHGLQSMQPHGLQPTRLLCPWHSPGKNTGVGCHFLLEIFPTQGWKQCLLRLLHWQAGQCSALKDFNQLPSAGSILRLYSFAFLILGSCKQTLINSGVCVGWCQEIQKVWRFSFASFFLEKYTVLAKGKADQNR